jgi:hypothetical protein
MTTTIMELPLGLTQRFFLGTIAEEGFDPTWQHVSLAIETGRELDASRVAEVVAALEARHPMLATRLAYRDGQPCLVDCSGSGRACQVLDLTAATDAEIGMCVAHHLDAPFDLLRGPLWRLVVARGPRGRSVIVFVCHHLVGDGISTWILLKDFGRLYFGGELDPESEPYREFLRAEDELLESEAVAQRLEYWEGALANVEPRLRVDRPPADELGVGEMLGLAFEEGAGAALMSNARARRVTPLSLLCGATLAAVKRAAAQQDMLCAVVTDTRGARFTRTVGAFSDLMLVRDPPAGAATESERLTALRNAFFKGWKHHLPIACLRERVPALTAKGPVTNPCDVYLNFIPVKTSSDWWNLIAPYGDESLQFYVVQQRNPPPTRRMLGPLFFFNYLHARDLGGGVAVRRHDALEELNHAVVAEMRASVQEMVAPVSAALD